MKRRIENRLLPLLFLAALFISLGTGLLLKKGEQNWFGEDAAMSREFRSLSLSDEMLDFLKREEDNPGRLAGLYLLETGFGEKIFRGTYDPRQFEDFETKWKRYDSYRTYETVCEQLWDDVEYFPVPTAINDKTATVSFTDSWLYERNYREGGAHEGTDIMADINRRGYYPVISMTDGIITNLGWLEMGGYRVGITAPKGAYFYYAHLSSYANLKEGMEIKAGDLLGFMGDSGYGKEEGTVGKFPVHLHVGVYLYPEGRETSYNPYWILRFLEMHKMRCKFL
ncbi:MAG: M23 family metallopeptidase [Hespellia sp.]|nr:M23 family metallopeptidase [Hespellia sp.]